MKLNKFGILSLSVVGLGLAASTVAVPTFAQIYQIRSNNNGASCPEMRMALNQLQAAQRDLNNAKHDYQGHRSQALKATNTAISQVQQGLQSRDCR